jgi:hypothetical protein
MFGQWEGKIQFIKNMKGDITKINAVKTALKK